MKFVHLSDLHIGKRVNEFSMLEDQEHILNEILKTIDEEAPDAVLIAGDVYDKSIPSTDAVEMLDSFLFHLAERKKEVFIISGNHDSPERLSFGSRLIDSSGIHIAPVYSGEIKPYPVKGVNIWLLPFIKPVHVRRFFEEESIESYNDAVRVAIRHMAVDPGERNLLVTHQFVTGADCTDSEERITVGGTDSVDASVFDGFDYVALGHIHRPQNCGSERIRYCGTPLKYSFSETNDVKSVTVGELSEDKQLTIRTVPLTPRHNMVKLRGSYDELMAKSFYEGTSYQEDYTHITLNDEEDIPDAVRRLRNVYHNLMKLEYDNQRTRTNNIIQGANAVENKSPLEVFNDFYREQKGKPLNDEQMAFLQTIIESIWEG